jgi:hypothetical protein
MRKRLLADPREKLVTYYIDPESADAHFFNDILKTALIPFFDDDTFFADLDRAISARMLADLGDIKQGQTVQDAKLDRMLAILENRGETAAAEAAGVQREAIIRLAQRIDGSIADFAQALAELDRAVELAIEVRRAGAQGSNLSAFVDDVLRRLAHLTAAGEYEAAGQAADDAIARWEGEEQERQARAGAELAGLLEAGERQDILRGDASAAAAKIVRRIALNTPEAQRFEAIRRVLHEWYERGRDKGLNLDLQVSIALARTTLAEAAGADQCGAGLNDLGAALATLGKRESGTETLQQAVKAFRKPPSTKDPRPRAPRLGHATQNNLGNALARPSANAKAAPKPSSRPSTPSEKHSPKHTRDRVPLHWAMTQNNLGNALWRLGERESGTETLQQAQSLDALPNAPKPRATRLGRDPATACPSTGPRPRTTSATRSRTLGERESGTDRLEQAVTAYRQRPAPNTPATACPSTGP